jgi:hypothetical protein
MSCTNDLISAGNSSIVRFVDTFLGPQTLPNVISSTAVGTLRSCTVHLPYGV